MKKYCIKESGYYQINATIEAIDENDAMNKVYDKLPNFINLQGTYYETNEVKMAEKLTVLRLEDAIEVAKNLLNDYQLLGYSIDYLMLEAEDFMKLCSFEIERD